MAHYGGGPAEGAQQKQPKQEQQQLGARGCSSSGSTSAGGTAVDGRFLTDLAKREGPESSVTEVQHQIGSFPPWLGTAYVGFEQFGVPGGVFASAGPFPAMSAAVAPLEYAPAAAAYPPLPGQAAHEQEQQQLFGLYEAAAAVALAQSGGGGGAFMSGAEFYAYQQHNPYQHHYYPETAHYSGAPGFELYGAVASAQGNSAYAYPQHNHHGQQPQDYYGQSQPDNTWQCALMAASSAAAAAVAAEVAGNAAAPIFAKNRTAENAKAAKGSSSGGPGHHLGVPSSGSRRSSGASTTRASQHLSNPNATSPIDFNCAASSSLAPAALHHNVQAMRQLSPLLAQLAPPQQLTRAQVRDYLANPSRYDCALWIFHAKVAQKSYGNEKRFFCPPPCVYLLGEGWRSRRKALDQLYRQLRDQRAAQQQQAAAKRSPARDSLFAGPEGRELFAEPNVSVGIGPTLGGAGGERQHAHQLDFSNGKDYCAAKALFISDADKRKYFHLQVHFSYAGGALELGLFPSQRIKVISKPSKKKQSMKSSDCKYLCVGNGSKIALFNRLRSQTVSTRYLLFDPGAVQRPAFVASSTKWGAFHINVVDSPALQQQHSAGGGPPSHSQSAIITYGSVIELVDSQTEMRLPLMRIRKVDKQTVLLDPAGQGEPVSQLHKCAFQMVDNGPTAQMALPGAEMLYLCLSHDKIIQHQAIRIDAHRHQISDGAAWTIISTDKSEFRWAEPCVLNGSVPRQSITPVPQLHALNMLQERNNEGGVPRTTSVELNGANFSPALRVWFGATPADTTFCAPERLSCVVPALHTVCADLGCSLAEASFANAGNGGKMDVPILLAREEDGVLYPTTLSFTFPLPPPAVAFNGSMQQPSLQQPVAHSSKLPMPLEDKKDGNSGHHLTENDGTSSSFAHLGAHQMGPVGGGTRFHPYANRPETGVGGEASS